MGHSHYTKFEFNGEHYNVTINHVAGDHGVVHGGQHFEADLLDHHDGAHHHGPSFLGCHPGC